VNPTLIRRHDRQETSNTQASRPGRVRRNGARHQQRQKWQAALQISDIN
jgi:hypothetical protein